MASIRDKIDSNQGIGMTSLLLLSYLYGIATRKEINCSKLYTTWQYFQIISAILIAICNILACVIFIYAKYFDDLLFLLIITAMGNISAVFSRIVFIIHQRNIQKMYTQMLKWIKDYCSPETKKKIMRKVGLMGLYVAGTCEVLCVLKALNLFLVDWSVIFGQGPKDTNSSNIELVTSIYEVKKNINNAIPIGLVLFMWELFVFNLNIIAAGIYTLGTNMLISMFYEIKNMEISNSKSDKLDQVRSLIKVQRQHFQLCEIVKITHTVFAPLIVVLTGTTMVNLCFSIRAIFAMTVKSTAYYVEIFSSGIMTLLLFWGVTMSSAKVNSLITKSIPLHTSDMSDDFYKQNTNRYLKIENEIKMRLISHNYVERIETTVSSLTGCGLFTLKRSTVLAVGSAILSYTLILYGV